MLSGKSLSKSQKPLQMSVLLKLIFRIKTFDG